LTDLLPDVIVFQEIIDLSSFQDLSSAITAYNFINTNYGYDLGLAVRSDCITILDYETLFPNNGYEFAYRYPLKAELRWSCGDAVLEFQLINIHLKAYDDGWQRRFDSCEILRNYIQYQIENVGQTNIIVAGDFNDEIDDPEGSNSLWPLVSDPNSYFTTTPIAGDSYYDSYPWSNYAGLLDHILISSGLFDENDLYGEIETLRIDDYMGSSTYQNHISDHRPVEWKIWLEAIDIPEGLVINEVMQNPSAVPDIYGEWFELTNIGNTVININGLVLKDNNGDYHSVVSDGGVLILPGEFLVLGREGDVNLNGGVELNYVYNNFNLGNTWDQIIIQHPTGLIIDEISYDNGETFPDPTGASMMLVGPPENNELGENWASSSQSYGDGDFGTPGSSNFSDDGLMVTVSDGWNLIGLPVMVEDTHYQSVFPSSVSGTLYGYNGVYTEEENVMNGHGYWLRFSETENLFIAGQEISTLSILLSEGWNLITGISQEFSVEDIEDPEGIIILDTFYEFDGTYTNVSSLEPGKGCWVKANSSGTIGLTFSVY
jgi:endonuclease/exonuclease/phosphatase family metal-dependent hydrolase